MVDPAARPGFLTAATLVTIPLRLGNGNVAVGRGVRAGVLSAAGDVGWIVPSPTSASFVGVTDDRAGEARYATPTLSAICSTKPPPASPSTAPPRATRERLS